MEDIKTEELKKLMKIEGKVRGVVFQTDLKYVLEKGGEAGLKKLEKRLKDLGSPIDYRGAKVLDWYPIGQRIISLLTIKELFNLSDQKIREMGSLAPKFSFVVKFLFKVFHPIKKLVKEIPRFWKEHYTIGELEVTKFDEKKKEIIIHLRGIKLAPLFCCYLEGFFESVLRFIEIKARARETKCANKGDPYHEYYLNW